MDSLANQSTEPKVETCRHRLLPSPAHSDLRKVAMFHLRILILICCTCLPVGRATTIGKPIRTMGGEAEHVEHFAEALERAKVLNADIVVLFHGSDWCRPGEVFKREVWDQKEFRRSLGKQFVLVSIDHPRSRKNRGKSYRNSMPQQRKESIDIQHWLCTIHKVDRWPDTSHSIQTTVLMKSCRF